MVITRLRRLNPERESEWLDYTHHILCLARYQTKIRKGDVEALQKQFEERASLLSKSTVQFAEIFDKPVGMIEAHLPYGRWAEIKILHVSPYFRGFGIGRQLVKEVIGNARRMDCGRVVVTPFEKSRDFYERMGFKNSDLNTSKTMSLDLR